MIHFPPMILLLLLPLALGARFHKPPSALPLFAAHRLRGI